MLTDYKKYAGRMVTFRDGVRSRIEGVGTNEIIGSPMLN